MKVLLSWLSEYVDTGLSVEKVAEVLSDLGLPTERIEYLDGDAVIDLEVTSNRGDCLGHIGVARELAAATGKELRLPVIELDESQKDVNDLCSVEIGDPDLCGRYTARVIEDIKVGPSPNWIVKRLHAAGVRSVSNVVDATNYAMMETGQPPHAFDYAKIAEGKIIVRKAKPGERIVSIDGTKCDLEPEMLIIADPTGPVAVAGVMGGLDTEVGEKTKTVLLEDAYFSPVSVRATSRRLGLPSEAAFRFERTVDIEMIDWASKRTAQLITQVAGGKVAKGVVDAYPKRPQPKQVQLRVSRLKAFLGIEVPTENVLQILSRLGFSPIRAGDVISCTVPSWRSDVYREADLIEEVARVHGYNKVPAESKIEIKVTPPDGRQKLIGVVGRYLNGCGFYETISVSFVDEDVSKLFALSSTDGHLAVRDESRKSSNLLRCSLLGSLFGVLRTNLNAKNQPCRIFEIANTFVPRPKETLPIERTKLGVVCDSDLRELRGVIEGLLESIWRAAHVVFSPADVPWAQVGAEIKVNGDVIGTAGVVSENVKARFGFEELTPCGAELDFDALATMESSDIKVKPIPRFPAIERDLSLVVDEHVGWSQITEVIDRQGCGELEQTGFVGVYRGKGIPEGKKSVTLTLRFRDEDGTLTHEAVDGFQQGIVDSLAKSTGAELRTA